MVKLLDLLLARIGEEAGEIGRIVGKVFAYSHDDVCPPGYPESGLSNGDILFNEVIDALANYELYIEERFARTGNDRSLITGGNRLTEEVVQKIRAKKVKTISTLPISIRTGRLSSEGLTGSTVTKIYTPDGNGPGFTLLSERVLAVMACGAPHTLPTQTYDWRFFQWIPGSGEDSGRGWSDVRYLIGGKIHPMGNSNDKIYTVIENNASYDEFIMMHRQDFFEITEQNEVARRRQLMYAHYRENNLHW
jgi:hypothetical protein